MFRLRSVAATDDEIRQQNIVVKIVFRMSDPITLLEKKAAALTFHPSIDFILAAKVFKSLDQVLDLVRDDSDLLEPEFKNKLTRILASVELNANDVIMIPKKSPVFVSPVKLLKSDVAPPPSINLPISVISNVSLSDFEAFAFGSKILYKYYKDSSFASYLFQNLIYSQNLISRIDLSVLYEDETQSWQSRLASLLYITNVNEQVATDVFYSDSVTYNKKLYNASFVPNYDVRNIQKLRKITPSASEQEMINYYYSFDPSTTTQVPEKYVGIFLSFPFKMGYWVHSNGRITFTNLPKIRKHSVTSEFVRICDITDISAAVENAARSVSLEDAVSYAAYAKTLTLQGIALMIIQRICGRNRVYIPIASSYLRIDNEYNLLSWMNFSCKKGKLMLPVLYRSPTGDSSIALVRDIARCSHSALGASIYCSAFCIPEIDINYTFAHLDNDSELYVLYTLVLQQYPNASYYAARNALRPKFGTASADLSIHRTSIRQSAPSIKYKNYPELMFEDPQSVPDDCTTDRCINDYEFSDEQLRKLVSSGETEMTNYQTSLYIASILK